MYHDGHEENTTNTKKVFHFCKHRVLSVTLCVRCDPDLYRTGLTNPNKFDQ